MSDTVRPDSSSEYATRDQELKRLDLADAAAIDMVVGGWRLDSTVAGLAAGTRLTWAVENLSEHTVATATPTEVEALIAWSYRIGLMVGYRLAAALHDTPHFVIGARGLDIAILMFTNPHYTSTWLRVC